MVRRPVVSLVLFGLFNVWNWARWIWPPGGKGSSVAWLLAVVVPLGYGLTSGEDAWFAAFVMSIPWGVRLTVDARLERWGEWLAGYSLTYLFDLGLVLIGREVRRVLARWLGGLR